MLKLSDEQLDWLLERIPDAPRSSKGGRAVFDEQTAREIGQQTRHCGEYGQEAQNAIAP
jgi:hypothetical protein